jgi:hypothetical protein
MTLSKVMRRLIHERVLPRNITFDTANRDEKATQLAVAMQDLDDEGKLRLGRLLRAKKEITQFNYEHREFFAKLSSALSPQFDEVIAFADKVTLTLNAPRDWQPGLPLIGAHPPAPQLEEMRAGHLEKYNFDLKKTLRKDEAEMSVDVAGVDDPVMEVVGVEDEQIEYELAVRSSLKRSLGEGELRNEHDVNKRIGKAASSTFIEVSATTATSTFALERDSQAPAQTLPAVAQEEEKRAPPVPAKQENTRQINVSFGLSDSESDDDE